MQRASISTTPPTLYCQKAPMSMTLIPFRMLEMMSAPTIAHATDTCTARWTITSNCRSERSR